MLVRDAQVSDVGAVARIGHRALPRVYASSVPAVILEAVLAQTYCVEALERCIRVAAGDAHFLVAEHEGRVVGFLHYDGCGSDPELHRIYLEPDLTGRGIGKQLLDELHSRLQPGNSYILLVVAANVGARAFYTREGFTEESRVDARSFYAKHMGVSFPPRSPQLECIVLRRTIGLETCDRSLQSGGGGIRTHEGPNGPQRFSRLRGSCQESVRGAEQSDRGNVRGNETRPASVSGARRDATATQAPQRKMPSRRPSPSGLPNVTTRSPRRKRNRDLSTPQTYYSRKRRSSVSA